MRSYFDQRIERKYTDKRGMGLFAKRSFRKRELVLHGRKIKTVSKRTNHSFQTGENTHVQLDTFARSINHSCNPNTGVRNNHCRGYDFIALKNIKKGEEITWDYETTEYESISVRNCLCGSKNCRKFIKGFKYLSEEIKHNYGEFIADYLKKINDIIS